VPAILGILGFVNAQTPVRELKGQYTDEARVAGIEGQVKIQCTISGAGKPQEFRVMQPLGLGLDEIAMQAVRQEHFPPTTPFATVTAVVAVDFTLPLKQSRWHLLGVEFNPPLDAQRPVFLLAKYRMGAGISNLAKDEAGITRMLRHDVGIKVSFDVDDRGVPIHFLVRHAPEEMWGPEAAAMLSQWRFKPGSRAGQPVSVPVTVDLSWGSPDLPISSIENLRYSLNPSRRPATVETDNFPGGLYTPPPELTEEARKVGLAGEVVVSLNVGADGTTRNLRIVRSLGMGLDESSLQTLSTWRFRPPVLNGKPTEVPIVVTINFYSSGRVKVSW
jgi:TonB family protein